MGICRPVEVKDRKFQWMLGPYNCRVVTGGDIAAAGPVTTFRRNWMNATTPTVTNGESQLPSPPGPRLPGIVQAALFPYRHRVTPWMRKRYGDIFAVSQLGRPSVLLCSPELNRSVLGGDVTTFHVGE